MKLYRASDDDVMTGPTSFAEDIDDARAYMDNPSFGGSRLWRACVCVPRRKVLDITDESDQEAAIRDAAGLEESDYANATVDFIVAQQDVVDALVAKGYEWVRLLDTFPNGSVTWTWLYEGDEPELTEIDDAD